VFASAIRTSLDAANVRREFRKITEAAGLGTEWAPRDLRHTFVSLMSADGVPIEEIARLAGTTGPLQQSSSTGMSCVPSSPGAPRRWTGS
jgi:site-specific recombinase XerD